MENNTEQQLRRSALDTTPREPEWHGGNIPNTPLAVCTISFLLGALFSLGMALFLCGGLVSPWWATYQLGFFIATWSVFHWGEFAVTAGWNRDRCSVNSFLLDNGANYHIANGSALIEYLITLYWKPSLKTFPYISQFGLVVAMSGQVLRTTAMIHASTNFSHAVAFRKRVSHKLVTDGIYSWSRHPSYAGFLYWSLGTQLVLQNPICFVGFAIILWRFFFCRIRVEERALVQFFGESYRAYRQKVGTKIPFIR